MQSPLLDLYVNINIKKETNLKRHMVTHTGLKLLLCTVWERLYSEQEITKSFENT